mmetsp:Transcript_19521/g.30530  ORF Transcript_19521/g.30530 Transcript_19521/m.30530 type:complete len:219 (-) Transcript_19521:105-761(-)
MGGATTPSPVSRDCATAAALDASLALEISSIEPPNITLSLLTDIADAPATVNCFTSFAASKRFLKLPVAGSILLHSGIMTNCPSAPARFTGPIQSLGFGFVGSVMAALQLVINSANGVRSLRRSTSVSFSHMYPSNADVGLAVFSATLHSTVETERARPECTSRLFTMSSPFSERGAASLSDPKLDLAILDRFSSSAASSWSAASASALAAAALIASR